MPRPPVFWAVWVLCKDKWVWKKENVVFLVVTEFPQSSWQQPILCRLKFIRWVVQTEEDLVRSTDKISKGVPK